MPPAKRTAADDKPDTTQDEPAAAPQTDALVPLTLDEHLAVAGAPLQGLSGWARICDALEVAFVHALKGGEAEARELLDDAGIEFAKFAPNLKHLEAQYSLLYARVLAVLEGK